MNPSLSQEFAFPAGSGINNRNSLDVISLSDIEGGPVAVGDDGATTEVRRSTVAARLRAIYGNVNNVDAFVGMMAEPHVTGSEFGELQQAIWRRQFQALRDGDRFFYGNRRELKDIKAQFGIDFRRTLAQVIASNTDFPLSEQNDNVFLVEDDDLPAASCAVIYTVASEWPNNFQVSLRIINTSGTALPAGHCSGSSRPGSASPCCGTATRARVG